MADLQKTSGKQAVKGKFPPGNKIGPRFPKGQSGNPSGRPKLTKLSEALREQLAQTSPDMPESSIAEVIADALIKEAIKGNVLAIREIADRTEGKPKQSLDVDFNVMDWRAMAQANGLTEEDVFEQAKLLIESADDSGNAERD